MFIGQVQLLTLLLLGLRIVALQLRCAAPNECDPAADLSCRPIGGCERYCNRNLQCRPPPRNCYCRYGFARHFNGSCIARADCPRACYERECPNHFQGCRCEQYCQLRNDCVVAPSGCHCARGYGRDNRNACVPLSLCPS